MRGGRIWARGEPVAAAGASASLSSSHSAPHDKSGVLTASPASLLQNTSNSLPLRCDRLTDSTCMRFWPWGRVALQAGWMEGLPPWCSCGGALGPQRMGAPTEL